MATREDVAEFIRQARDRESLGFSDPIVSVQPDPVNSRNEVFSPSERLSYAVGQATKAGIDTVGLGLIEAAANIGSAISSASSRVFGTRDIPQEAFATRQFVDSVRKGLDTIFPKNPALAESFLDSTLPGALGSGVGFIVGGGVIKKGVDMALRRSALKMSALEVGARMGAGIGFNEFYEDAKDNGGTQAEQFSAGLIGAGVGLTEAVTLGPWISRVTEKLPASAKRTFLSKLAKVGEEGIAEALQESFQGLSQNLTAKAIGYDPDRGTLEGVFEGGAAGGLTGVILSALTQAYGGRRVRKANTVGGEPIPEMGIDPETATLPVLPEEKGGDTNANENQDRERGTVAEGSPGTPTSSEGQRQSGSPNINDEESGTQTLGTTQGEREGISGGSSATVMAMGAVPPKTISSEKLSELTQVAASKRAPASPVEVQDPEAAVDLPVTPGSALVFAVNPQTRERYPLKFEGYVDQRPNHTEKELEAYAESGTPPIQEVLTSGKPIPSLTQEGFATEAGASGYTAQDLESHGYQVEGIPSYEESEGHKRLGDPIGGFQGLTANQIKSGEYPFLPPSTPQDRVSGENPPETPPEDRTRSESNLEPPPIEPDELPPEFKGPRRRPTTALQWLATDEKFKREHPDAAKALADGTYIAEPETYQDSIARAIFSGLENDPWAVLRAIQSGTNPYLAGIPDNIQVHLVAVALKNAQARYLATDDARARQELRDFETEILRFTQIQKASQAGKNLQAIAALQRSLSPEFWAEHMINEVTNGRKKVIPGTVVRDVKQAHEDATENTLITKEDVQNQVKKTKKKEAKVPRPGSRSLNDVLKDLGVDFNEFIKLSREEQGEFLENLTKILRNDPRFNELSGEDIEHLAESIVTSFEEKRNALFDKVLERLKGLPTKKIKSKKKRKTVAEKLSDLARLGDLKGDDIQQALADGFTDLQVLTQEERDKLYDMVVKMQNLPEGIPRNRAHQNILNYIADKAGLSVGEFMASFWYASVLSGLGTQSVNVFSTAFNVALETSALLVSGNPQAASRMLRASYIGMIEGAKELGPIFKRGDFTRRLESEITRASNPLELYKASTGTNVLFRGLSQASYVLRFMTAMDTLNGAISKRPRIELAAYNKVKSEYPDWNISKIEEKMNELLGTTPAQRKSVLAQATAEVAQGIIEPRDFDRRVIDLTDQMIPTEILEDAKKYAQFTTYNSKPTGPLGTISEAILQARKKHPYLLTPIIPFVTIPFNVTNALLNYTPWGLARVIMQQQYLLGNKKNIPGGVFDTQLDYMKEADFKALQAKMVVGTLVWASLMVALYQFINDDEDKEDPLIAVNGGWFGLSRAETGQLRSAGQVPWSIKVGRGSSAKAFSFKDTPLGLFFGTMGITSDMIRFQGMDTKTTMQNTASLLVQGFGFLTDMNALATIADIGEAINAKDENLLIHKANQLFTRPIGGFIPNITREMESWVDPTVYTASNTVDYILKDIPVVRSHSGLRPMINVLGEEIEIRRTPWRRFIQANEGDPVWDAVAKRANKGLFIPIVRRFSLTMPDGTRRKVTEDEFYTYQKRVGDRYKEWLTRNLPLFENLSDESVEKNVYRTKFSEIREQERNRLLREIR